MSFSRTLGVIPRFPTRCIPVRRFTTLLPIRQEVVPPVKTETVEPALENNEIKVEEAAPAEKTELTLEELGESKLFDKRIKRAFVSLGYDSLTPVQSRAIIPMVKEQGVVCRAKTGTGKTMAFVIPSLQASLENASKSRGVRSKVQALVIAPTRDLAMQIKEEYMKIAERDATIAKKCQIRLCIGGKAESIRTPPSIIVATPGRLEANLRKPAFSRMFSDLKYRIYDEADRLLDQGFEESLYNIDKMLKEAAEDANEPGIKLKSVLFSATVNENVDTFAKATMGDNYKYINCVDENEPEAHENIHQTIVRTNTVFESHVAAISDIFRTLGTQKKYKAILFVPTVSGTDFLHSLIKAAEAAGQFGEAKGSKKPKMTILKLHGQIAQNRRDNATRMFRQCETGILVCTDVAARGLDFKNVTDVIQIGPTADSADYVHKVGRTARAGSEGNATLYLSTDEYKYRKALERERGVTFNAERTFDTFDEDLVELNNLYMEEEEIDDYGRSMLGFYRSVVSNYRLDMRAMCIRVIELVRAFKKDPTAKMSMSGKTYQQMGIPRDLAHDYFDVHGAIPGGAPPKYGKGRGGSRSSGSSQGSYGKYTPKDGYSGNKGGYSGNRNSYSGNQGGEYGNYSGFSGRKDGNYGSRGGNYGSRGGDSGSDSSYGSRGYSKDRYKSFSGDNSYGSQPKRRFNGQGRNN